MKRNILIAVVVVIVLAGAGIWFLPEEETPGVMAVETQAIRPPFFPAELLPQDVSFEAAWDYALLESEAHRAIVSYQAENMAAGLAPVRRYFAENGFAVAEERGDSGMVEVNGTKDSVDISATAWEGSPAEIFIVYVITQ